MDIRLLARLFLLLSTGWISTSAMSADTDQTNDVWTIIHAEGLTQAISIPELEAGKEWRNVSTGENLPGPSYLRTGPDSRIVLKHRNDKITIASSSLIKLEAEKYASEGIFTKIVQSVGYAIFDIESNTGRTNVVETPYLVSVVKGTTFTVHVSEDRTVVNLIKGRLQVNATSSDLSTFISSGQSAQMGRGDVGISVLNTRAQINPSLIIKNQASSILTETTSSVKAGLRPVLGTAAETADGLTGKAASAVSGVADLTGATGFTGVAGVTEVITTRTPTDSSGAPLVDDFSNNPLPPLHELTEGTGPLPPLPPLPPTPALP